MLLLVRKSLLLCFHVPFCLSYNFVYLLYFCLSLNISKNRSRPINKDVDLAERDMEMRYMKLLSEKIIIKASRLYQERKKRSSVARVPCARRETDSMLVPPTKGSLILAFTHFRSCFSGRKEWYPKKFFTHFRSCFFGSESVISKKGLHPFSFLRFLPRVQHWKNATRVKLEQWHCQNSIFSYCRSTVCYCVD